MKKILVVDDNDSLRRMTSEALKDFGFEVFEAGNGEEGLGVIRDEDVDLVFTDVVMPGRVSSVEMVTMAKVDMCKSDLKVIFTSGYPDVDTTIAGDNSEMITKPYRLQEVIEKINGLLN